MRFHAVDWRPVIRWSALWADVDIEVRELALLHWGDRAKRWEWVSGPERQRLFRGGAVHEAGEGSRDPRPTVDPGFRRFLELVLHMAKADPLHDQGPRALAEYVGEQLRGRELRRVLGDDAPLSPRAAAEEAASVDRAHRFLEDDAFARAVWARAREGAHQEDLFGDPAMAGAGGTDRDGAVAEMPGEPHPEPVDPEVPPVETARAVIRTLVEWDEPVPLHVLAREFPEPEHAPAETVAGLLAGLLAFPALDAEARPAVVLWPRVARGLRPRAPAPEAMPEPPEGARAFPFLVADMASLLIAAAARPLRVRKSDHAFYTRDVERLGDELVGLPEALDSLADFAPRARIMEARRFLAALDLAAMEGGVDEPIRIVPTPGGREWMAGSAEERLRVVMDRLKESGPWGGVGFLPGHSVVPLPGFDFERCREAVVEAFRSLPAEGVVPIGAFLRHQVEEANPLLDLPDRAWSSSPWPDAGGDSDEQARMRWSTALHAFLLQRLIPLGGGRVAGVPELGPCVGLTPVGRYLLDLTDTLEYEEGLEGTRLRIQPDFELVFLAPSPEAEAAVGRFAERTGEGVGALFRITPGAARAAAAVGLTANGVLDVLHRAGEGEVPENVEREIRGWMGAARRIPAREALVLDAGDEETAGRLLSAGGKAVRSLGPTTVEVVDGRLREGLLRRLADEGLFVEPPSET